MAEVEKPEVKKVRSWGYSAKDAKIFLLAPNERLPAGYYDSPAKVKKPKTEAG